MDPKAPAAVTSPSTRTWAALRFGGCASTWATRVAATTRGPTKGCPCVAPSTQANHPVCRPRNETTPRTLLLAPAATSWVARAASGVGRVSSGPAVTAWVAASASRDVSGAAETGGRLAVRSTGGRGILLIPPVAPNGAIAAANARTSTKRFARGCWSALWMADVAPQEGRGRGLAAGCMRRKAAV